MARPSRRILLFFSLVLWLSCEVEPPVQPGTNRAPTARISGAQASDEGTFIAFDASGSTDPDGDSLTYAWDFGDGQKRTGGLAPHAYQNEGSYQVSLIVTDYRGASDTARATMSVENAPPVITGLVVPSTPVGIGTPVTIHVAFSDPGTADSLIASVEWGDQTSSPIAGGSASHTYAAVGNYMVTATVRDDVGAETQQTASSAIIVQRDPPPVGRPPIAHAGGPYSVDEGYPTSFNARASTDPDGDSLTYAWDIGGPGTLYGYPTGPEPWVMYFDDGAFTVRVIVTDQNGRADTATARMTVRNVAPKIRRVESSSAPAGTPASLRVDAIDASYAYTADTLTVVVAWGDGTTSSSRPDSTMTHVYSAVGVYTVQIRVLDGDGAEANATTTIAVFDPAARKVIAGYEVIDLGTLGGNWSLPHDMNDYGQIVGSSLTASGANHAFLWENGVLSDLGTLGYEESFAQRINNAGQIAGSVLTRDGGRSPIAATWRNGVGIVLNEVREEFGVSAAAINESGAIAWNVHGHENPYAWVWQGSWQRLGGLLHPLGMSYGLSMNERGQIVGGSAAVSTGESPWPYEHAFLWENGTIRDLGLLGVKPCPSNPDRNCSSATATSINENGQVAGFSSAADGSYHAVLWENGTVRDLWTAPAAGHYYDRAAVINDRGQVAGSYRGVGFFWSNGTLTLLGSLGGGVTEVVDMNEAGIVVGTSTTASGERHAFAWTQAQGMIDLGTGPHGFNWTQVVGISFRGDIVGYSTQCNSDFCYYSPQSRAILWRKP